MKTEIDRSLWVRGIGRWPTLFNNKMVNCMWSPEKTGWIFTHTSPDVVVSEDPEFFIQHNPGTVLKVRK